MDDEKTKAAPPKPKPEPSPDGTMQIEVLAGPYRGNILTVTEAQADSAIAERWARWRTFPPVDQNAPMPEPYTPEELEAAVAAAEAAAPLLRGETPPDVEKKTVTAEPHAASYSTRSAAPGTAPNAPKPTRK